MNRPLLLCSLLASAPVAADPADVDGWVTVETPAAVAISDVQSGIFSAGAMPAVGLYASRNHIAVGIRGRAGVLRDGAAPGMNLRDPGFGGLGTIGVALRATAGGAWLEAVGGGGITGNDRVPVLELGAGYTFAAGPIDLGPSVRYVRVVASDPMATFGTADLALVGLDVRFGRDRKAAKRPPVERMERVVVVAAEPPPPPPPEPAISDRDVVVDRDASCAEAFDGCPIADDLFVIDDRIVLGDEILFELDRTRVRTSGRKVIGEIAKAWKVHPEWARLSIEGHADVRGTDEYNQTLSERRAQKCRLVFVNLGFDPTRIDAVGYGRSRPAVRGSDEASHAQNRRVEFVIERELPASAPAPAPASAAAPAPAPAPAPASASASSPSSPSLRSSSHSSSLSSSSPSTTVSHRSHP